MFVRATCFAYIDFLDIDGLINLEVGNETCSVLKQRGCATRELYGNRRVDSRKRDKEQMRPFDTTEKIPLSFSEMSSGVMTRQKGI